MKKKKYGLNKWLGKTKWNGMTLKTLTSILHFNDAT
jgi:hypothetical protein